MERNLLMDGFHDAEIYGLNINKEKGRFELFIVNSNNNNIILYFENPVFWEFNFLSLQNSVYEITIFDKDEIPEFIIQEYKELIPFKNNDYYDNYKLVYISPSTGLEGVILFKSFNLLYKEFN